MDEIIVDARGEICPKPLILTKQALKNCGPDQPVRIFIDNATSKDNVMRFLSDNGYFPECIENDGVFTLTLAGSSEFLSHPDAAAYCTTCAPSVRSETHVVVIKSNRMGDGDDALGELLLKACINTIKEVTPLPQTIIFYNSGIFMATDESPVIASLKDLESKGVKILVCGTCADYYEMKDLIHIGIISNMYTILETITSAGKIIEP